VLIVNAETIILPRGRILKLRLVLGLLFVFSFGIARADDDFFEKEIRPLLSEHCQSCHGERKQEGNLKLTTRESMLKGGDSGVVVRPGNPDESVLIRAVEYLGEQKMPPKQKLADADIAKLRRWVMQGASWPESSSPAAPHIEETFSVTPAQKTWWAFQPVKDRVPPAVSHSVWPQNEIDQFVAAELEVHKLQPAPHANRQTWLRRVTFDVTGLPPTPEELEAFLVDQSDQAFERVIDRLLASPEYGPRWARHWLDIARYADYHDGDPKARTASCDPLQAWRYRDWVVQAFNRDLPFDEFIMHQIAGDLLPDPAGGEFYADGLVATTFLTNGSWDRGDADKEKMVSDMVDDNIDTIGKAFMGLTIGCARCHDHKFDPISHEDYYALAGVFYSTHILQELGIKGGEYTLNRVPLVDKAYLAKRREQLQALNEVQAKLTELDKKTPKPPDDDPERQELVSQRDSLQSELLPEPPLAEAAAEGGTPGGLFPGIQDVPIHIRGSYTRLGPIVPRRMPSFFEGDEQPRISSGSGRRQVADWVTSKQNPLTARVIVNRVWQWHFGSGLVRTPNNFGLLSEPPSHPALLDWLASRFVEDGWSLKKLHRRILLSATYGQSSVVQRDQISADPDNLWLGRFPAHRLEAEAIRDAMLFTSGRLDFTQGGPASNDLSIDRRSLYVQTARWDRNSFAMLFDAANPDASDEKRNVSTVAPQALFLLNDSFTLAQAKHLAKRLIRDVPTDVPNFATARIQYAYRLLFNRSPTAAETVLAQQLVKDTSLPDPNTVWADLAHILLCTNEFVYID